MKKGSKEFYEFRKQLKFLETQRGEGTELISVYIPSKSNVNEVTNRLRDEYGQAMNIKSKQTRKNVQTAIDRIVQMLKGVHKPPENGVAIFCGSVKGKIELYNIVPPEPISVSIYRCDSSFFLDPLRDMIEPKDLYGLVVLDRREATIALLKGKRIDVIKHMTSGVPGKHSKGGWSQKRFERLIEIAASEFFTRIGDKCNQVFGEAKVKGVLVGGSGPTKHDFVKGDFLHAGVKKKIAGLVDTGYTDEFGIQELVNKADEVIKGLESAEEKILVDKFLKEATVGGLATYGLSEVKEALVEGKVNVLLLSEELDEELINEFTELAEKTDAKIEIVSVDTAEGKQFSDGFKGIGALLRYK